MMSQSFSDEEISSFRTSLWLVQLQNRETLLFKRPGIPAEMWRQAVWIYNITKQTVTHSVSLAHSNGINHHTEFKPFREIKVLDEILDRARWIEHEELFERFQRVNNANI